MRVVTNDSERDIKESGILVVAAPKGLPKGLLPCVGNGLPVPVTLTVPVPGVPEDPPAAFDSSAKPIDGGVARNTEYTFLRKTSPTTQLGLPLPPALEPKLRSKIPPRHWDDCDEVLPRFISSLLSGHDLPPKAIVT